MRLKVVVLAAFTCFLSSVVALVPGRIQAQNAGWSRPQQLSALGSPAWFPDIVADLSGRVHVVWAGGDSEFDQVLYRELDPVTGWSSTNDLAAFPIVRGESAATRPSLLADDQLLHITYTNYDGVYYSNVPILEALSAGTWQDATVVDGDQTSYFSRVARDTDGNLHLVYTENTPQTGCQQCYHLYYIRSSDQGQRWSVPYDISIASTGAAKPQIVVGPDGVIHVVWESGYGGGLGQVRDPTQAMYASSNDNGNTWSVPMELSATEDPDELARNITIGIDRNGALLAVWSNQLQQVVNYRVSRDGGRTWLQTQSVPGLLGGWSIYQQRLDDFTIAQDSGGNLHLVTVGRRMIEQPGLDLLHTVWNGSGWSTPEVVASYNGDVPEWPRLAVNLGNQLDLVWFVRGEKNLNNSDAGDFSVFYASRTVDSPPIAPGEIVAPRNSIPDTNNVASVTAASTVPALVATISPMLEVDAPKNSLETTIFGQKITSENDEVLLITLALLPVPLIILAIALYRRQRR